MQGTILNIENDTTTILVENHYTIEINTQFLPLKFKTGDTVELENNKIVLRSDFWGLFYTFF